jgi:hypothetical protein
MSLERRWSWPVLVVLAALLGQWLLLRNPGYFSHDELQWAARAAGLDGGPAWVDPLDLSALQYRPLTFNLWLLLARGLSDAPLLYHALWVLLGLGVGGMLYLLLRRYRLNRRLAAAGTLAFLLNPYAAYVHGWVATLADLLWVGAALGVALLATGATLSRRVRTGAIFLVTALGLLGKEAAVVIPLLCLLAWWLDPQRARWREASLAGGAAVALYLPLRVEALWHAAAAEPAYAWSLAALPARLFEYPLFLFLPTAFEPANTLEASGGRLAIAALLALVLLCAAWRRDRRLAGWLLLGGAAALGPVLLLERPAMQYGYGYSALLAGVGAAAASLPSGTLRVLLLLCVLVSTWHGINIQRGLHRVGRIEAVFSPQLAPLAARADAGPLRLRVLEARDAWIYRRLTHGLAGYRGQPYRRSILLVEDDQPASHAIAADGSIRVLPAAQVLAAGWPPSRRLVAAHYFGRGWAKNFIAGFRREEVAADFRQLRADGFNAVVLVVSWGDFQPRFDPCCGYDERAFERLGFLLEQARAAGLAVLLRVGYAWTFHPEAGDSGGRVHVLLNQPAARTAYLAFVQRIAAVANAQPQVVLSFQTWEDQWLHRIDESARADFAEFLETQGLPLHPAGAALPDPEGGEARLFHRYWDWLAMERLHRPAQRLLPALSYEARIDKEPERDASGAVVDWIAHERMLALPAGVPATIYWAPFWGAGNQGERVPAALALQRLDYLLAETQRLAPDRPIFIDQLNFIDNTPGFEGHAVLVPADIPAFLAGAACSMRRQRVLGYAFWTVREYRESPLYNPAFAYGLEGWALALADPSRAPLQALPGADPQLQLAAGDRLSQRIGPRRGRLPAPDEREDRVCVYALATEAARLSVRAGGGEPARLAFAPGPASERCVSIDARPVDDELVLELRVDSGRLALRDVQLFDHLQTGGIRLADGSPGPWLEAVRTMSATFLGDDAGACAGLAH